MSRQQSGKSPILVLAWRYSLFVVTPIYLFVLWLFYPLLNTYGFAGRVWWMLVWWLSTNAGAFSLSVGVGRLAMRLISDQRYGRRREYRDWRRAGGCPFWDVLPWTINTDPDVVRMAITVPPDHDACPLDGYPLGRRFGNQCRALCGAPVREVRCLRGHGRIARSR